MSLIKKGFVPILAMAMILLTGANIMSANERRGGDDELKHNDYYTEKYRPQYHFSTETGRLADPNGLVYFEGEYHLFHQKMGTWAHAVSEDLVHWEHLPIALEHDELGQALSGSAIVDWNDSSGFFNGKAGLIAFYTNTEGGEAQSIAYSKDNGRTWERYDGNPVIENPGIKDFRDPKVFWHEGSEKWVMVVSTNQSVTFYNSDNLIDWKYQSRFGDEEGSHVAVWECPDLFRLPVDGNEENQKWVLHVSVGDNHVTDGSTAQYFIGEFDGKQFVNDHPPESILTTDFGQDYYAAQSFANLSREDGRTVWLGWMANWRYPYQSPTEPWMGSMSIPRELSLKTTEEGVRLFQEPIHELQNIRATNVSTDAFTLEGEQEIKDFQGTTYEFETVVEWDRVEEFGIRLRQSETEETIVGINPQEETVFLDRTNAGLETLIDRDGGVFQFGKRFETGFSKKRKQVKIHGFVDESSVELFINDGEYVFTNLIYSNPTGKGIELYTKGGSVDVVSLDFYHLHSIWGEVPDEGKMDRIAVSEEAVELEVGESIELTAHAKPDWLSVTEPFVWEAAQSNLIEIDEIDESRVNITGVQLGLTTVTVRDPNSQTSKDIAVRVLEDKESDYINGWGPSPVTGAFSGKWDILNTSSVTSHVENSPEWKEIYRDEVITDDFAVSADIEWSAQGNEGFPKYGITIVDEKGTTVSAFFNQDIHQLESFMKYSDRELGWEGADLPADIKLQAAQNLKVERKGNVLQFFFNEEIVQEREIQMEGDISVGLINENTAAKFTNFKIEKERGYKKGWGPSPVTGSFSGNWDIIDEASVTSLLGSGDDWTEIFKEQIMTGDFTVSTDTKWLDQGSEGFPKYGIVLTDGEDTLVSALLNININELETFSKFNGKELGWKGVKLPSGTNLKEAQNIKAEKVGNTFTFYFNDEPLYESTIEMKGDISVGIVNINTKAEFTNYTILDNNEAGEVDKETDDDKDNGSDHKQDGTDKDTDGNKEPKHDEGKENGSDAGNTGDKNDTHSKSDKTTFGRVLPNTATNQFNTLLLGIGLVLIGGLVWMYLNRQKKMKG